MDIPLSSRTRKKVNNLCTVNLVLSINYVTLPFVTDNDFTVITVPYFNVCFVIIHVWLHFETPLTCLSGHLSPTPLVATYENHSRKQPAPVTDIFIASQGCPLTRVSTVVNFWINLNRNRSAKNSFENEIRIWNLQGCALAVPSGLRPAFIFGWQEKNIPTLL